MIPFLKGTQIAFLSIPSFWDTGSAVMWKFMIFTTWWSAKFISDLEGYDQRYTSDNGSTQESHPWTGWISLLRCYRQFVRNEGFSYGAERDHICVVFVKSYSRLSSSSILPSNLERFSSRKVGLGPWDAEKWVLPEQHSDVNPHLENPWPLCNPVLHHKKCCAPWNLLISLPILSVCCCGFVLCLSVCSAASGLFFGEPSAWTIVTVGRSAFQEFFCGSRRSELSNFQKVRFCCSKFFPPKVGDFFADSSPWKKLLGTKTDGKISSVCPPQETSKFKKSSNPTAQEFRFGGRKTFKHQNYSGNWDATFRKHYWTSSLSVASIFFIPKWSKHNTTNLGMCKKTVSNANL